jgi:hypothetical protein
MRPAASIASPTESPSLSAAASTIERVGAGSSAQRPA